MKYPDGEFYEGEFSKDGKFHGQGKYYNSDGSRYEGEWKDGKYNGQGVFYGANGDKFVGEFLDGEATGQGKFYSKDDNSERTHDYKDGVKISK